MKTHICEPCYLTLGMADICKELREQLKELDGLRESCVSALVREGAESETTKKTIREFDTLAEELRDDVAFYSQPFSAHLDRIERKIAHGVPCTKREYRLLYDIDQYPRARGYDIREQQRQIYLKERRSDTQKKQDIACALDTTIDRISLTKLDALLGKMRYHCGDLKLDDFISIDDDKIVLPEEIEGSLSLGNLISVKGFTLPKKVGGSIDLNLLESIDIEFTMPEEVGGDLNLRHLVSTKKLALPKTIGGSLYLTKLTSVDNLITFPEKIGGHLYLYKIASVKRSILPKEVGGNLSLAGLTSADEVTLPEEIGGDLYLNSLTSTQGITNWPVKIIGTIQVNQALPGNEKAALEKRYPNKIRYDDTRL